MNDAAKYLKRLELSNVLREPLIRTIIDTLALPPGGKGLDAGCGTGFYTLILADAAGAHGHVCGLDLEESFLEKGRALAIRSGQTEQVSFIHGAIEALPFENKAFDWAFSMDLVGYPKSDPLSLLKELARTVKPGGSVFILNWSSQMLLPGYPLLEARLNATSLGLAPLDSTGNPELHLLRAPEWFRQAGLSEVRVQTFVRDLCSPFSSETYEAMLDLLEMRWGEENTELPPAAQLEYQRLCRAGSPDLILNLPGYYGFFTYTLCSGRV